MTPAQVFLPWDDAPNLLTGRRLIPTTRKWLPLPYARGVAGCSPLVREVAARLIES